MADGRKNFGYSTVATAPTAGGSTDNFDRADSNTLGSSWVEGSGSDAAALQIKTNQLRCHGCNADCSSCDLIGWAYWNVAVADDQAAILVFKAASSRGRGGPGVRFATGGSLTSFTGYIAEYDAGAAQIKLRKLVAQSLVTQSDAGTTLGTYAVTLVSGDIVKVQAVGTAIKVFVNNVERISATDSGITTGKPGVVAGRITSGGCANIWLDWDDWDSGLVIETLAVEAGHGTRFPAVPFNATVWPAGVNPLVTNAEIIRVTAIATDTFTISRAQEGSSQRTIVVGDQIAATITAKAMQDLDALQDSWVAFTPTWTALSTNPAIGNGTLTGRYLKVGKTVWASIKLVPGSTTTFGSGEWRFTTPTEARDTIYMGPAYALDAGVSHYGATARVVDLSPAKIGVYPASGGAAYSSSVPFTWGNGDVLFIMCQYEEA